MDLEIDHYKVLGLPSGEEGAKLSEKVISKAYKLKALELHPDKRRDDPNAHENFQKLKTSYEILKDEKARKLFDDLLRVKHEKIQRLAKHDSKRRRMMSDLEEREREAFVADPTARAKDEEERISRELKEEIDDVVFHLKLAKFRREGIHDKLPAELTARAKDEEERIYRMLKEEIDDVVVHLKLARERNS